MLQLGGKFYHVPGKSNIFSSHARRGPTSNQNLQNSFINIFLEVFSADYLLRQQLQRLLYLKRTALHFGPVIWISKQICNKFIYKTNTYSDLIVKLVHFV